MSSCATSRTCAAFNQVWAEAFEGAPPATSVTPTSNPGFAIEDSRIEINLVAATDRKQRAAVRMARQGAVCDGHPVAVRAGDLLMFSGLTAADEDGLIPAARIGERERYVASSVEAQVEHLIDIAEEVCAKAGTSLRNVARILQVHTDLAGCPAGARRLAAAAAGHRAADQRSAGAGTAGRAGLLRCNSTCGSMHPDCSTRQRRT